MSDEIRINRPAQQSSVKPEPVMDQQEPKTNNKAPWIILGVIVLVLILAGFMFRGQLFGKKGADGKPAGTAVTTSSGYQAIFLTNGQVYFGKLSHPGDDYVTLDDIYYLQVGPAQGSGATQTPQTITLVKLGSELHGPVDEMHISRTQILFYEDLKADGGVVTAILKDKAAPAPAK